MDKTAIEKIEAMAKPNTIGIGGRMYTDKRIFAVEEPEVGRVALSTLSGLVDIVKQERQKFPEKLVVHVVNSYKVNVYSSIRNSDRSRETPYVCEWDGVDVDLDCKMDYESMMIMLKSRFVQTPEMLELVKLLGNITEQNSAQVSDDGFSQKVVVRKGIALKDNKTINPIIKLRPYRTFLEVEQPESEFLLRLSEGAQVALYEADGGAWKLEARKNIANYLRESLKDSGAIVVE